MFLFPLDALAPRSSSLFVINGGTASSVVPRLPAIKAALELSNTQLGIAIAAFPAGALVAGLFVGTLIARFGSAKVAVATCLLGGVLLISFGLAPAWLVLISAYFALGATDAVTDVAMNAHGLRVQRLYRRSIINAFHGWWSVGAVGGGLLGSAAAGLAVPVVVHLGVVGLLLVVASLVAYRFTLPGHEASERTDIDHDASHISTGALRPVATLLIMLGVITLTAAVVEDSAASWGALYMLSESSVNQAVAGLAFVSCQAFQTVGRFTADRLVERFGPVTVARLGGVVAALGTGLLLAVPHPVVIIAGFGLAGLGIASIFPGTYHAARNLPGVPTGAGVAVVSYIARIGFLISPPIVGVVSDQLGLRVGLLIVPVAAVLIGVLAGALRPQPEVGAER